MSTNKGIKDDTKYKVNLGNSFTKNTQGSYHVFQYNFKPSKIDRTKEGLLKKSGSKLEVHFPTNQGKSLFVGEYTPVKDVECILIFNGSEFTLEKISGSTKTIRELQSSYDDLNSPTANSSAATPTPAAYSSNSNVTPKENGNNSNANLKKRSPTSPPIGSPPLKKVSPEGGKKTTNDKYSRNNKKEDREKEKREKEKREKEERDRAEREKVREREEREKRELEMAIPKEDWDNKAISKNEEDHDFNFSSSDSDVDSYSENEHEDDNELTLVRAKDQNNTISTPVTILQSLSQPLPQLSSLPNPAIPTPDQSNKDDVESGSSGSEVSGSESDSSGSGSGSESDSGSESESESGSESESQSESESDNDKDAK